MVKEFSFDINTQQNTNIFEFNDKGIETMYENYSS